MAATQATTFNVDGAFVPARPVAVSAPMSEYAPLSADFHLKGRANR